MKFLGFTKNSYTDVQYDREIMNPMKKLSSARTFNNDIDSNEGSLESKIAGDNHLRGLEVPVRT
jgi:hypothetical protein